ncbi:MAG: hypothetical protein DWI21_08615 [Planctomycetota bacterium]|nr:MAG: hypothetical protein DWI21_08615 [Planctomycetota bacterium]GDY07153.1 hypothetical protein LBMAG52_06390 [Planctomycetia bacterium]
MRFELLCVVVLSLGTCFVIGCGERSAPSTPPAAPAAASTDEAKFSDAIAKLPEADRAVATAQRFCVVEDKSRLGSMGMPHKIMVEGQPVFLCCAGCEEEALKDAQATLAKVEKMKMKAATN